MIEMNLAVGVAENCIGRMERETTEEAELRRARRREHDRHGFNQ